MALNHSWFNIALQVKGFPMEKARRDLFHLQQLSRADLLLWQEKKRWEMVQHHAQFTAVYQQLVGQNPLNDWASLPIVTKKHLQGDWMSLLATPWHGKNLYRSSTSGSSGQPFFFAKDPYAHAMTYAIIQQRYATHGIHFGQKQARFYGIPLHGAAHWKERAKDLIANRIRFPVFDLSASSLHRFVARFKRHKFHYVYGYSSALVQFARYVLAQDMVLKQLCPTLTACVVTAEMCFPDDIKLLQQAFGVPVVNEYGASELDTIAITDANGAWILSDENVYVEVVDEDGLPVEYGQTGRLLVTSLHNHAFPMIRYDLGDFGAIARGNTSELLHLQGRSNDLIQLPSGKVAAGLTFYYVARQLLEQQQGIQEFVVLQTTRDTFQFDMVVTKPLDATAERQLRDTMTAYLEPGLQLKFNYVAAITRTSAGKCRHFQSLVPPW
jgi:phenylacetate-CoA ligase